MLDLFKSKPEDKKPELPSPKKKSEKKPATIVDPVPLLDQVELN